MKRRTYISPQEEIPDNKIRIKSADLIWEEDSLIKTPNKPGIFQNPGSIRASLPFFPKSNKCNMSKIPNAFIVTPSNDENRPKLFKNSEIKIPKCEKCGAYYCSATKFDTQRNKIVCATCGNTYLPEEAFDLMNFHVNQQENFEIINDNKPKSKHSCDNIFIAIDTSSFARSSGFLESVVSSLLSIFDSFDDRKQVILVTYDATIRIYDSLKARILEIVDLDDVTVPPIKFRSIKETRNYYKSVLEKLIESKEKGVRENCIGSVYDVAIQLLKDGGLAVVFSASYATCGPFVVRSPKLCFDSVLYIRRKVSLYYDITNKMNEMNISLHIFFSSDGDEDIHVLGAPSAFTSGSIHVYSNCKRDGKIMYSEISNVLLGDYFCNAKIEIIIPRSLELKNISANGIETSKNSVSLTNFPKNDTFAFEVDFPEKPKAIKTSQVVFQVHLRYIDEDGNERIRVLTHCLNVCDDATKIRENADQLIVLSALTRRFAKTKYTKPLLVAVKELTTNKDPKIRSLIKFFADSPVIREDHPIGEDGRSADLVALNSYDPIRLLLYICKRVEYFGNKTGQPFCMAVQSVSAVAFIVSEIAEKDWLVACFGVDSIAELPKELPHLQTNGNKELWDFATKYIKDVSTIVYQFEP